MHVRKLREREREISRENIKAKENKAAVIYECGRKKKVQWCCGR